MFLYFTDLKHRSKVRIRQLEIKNIHKHNSFEAKQFFPLHYLTFCISNFWLRFTCDYGNPIFIASSCFSNSTTAAKYSLSLSSGEFAVESRLVWSSNLFMLSIAVLKYEKNLTQRSWCGYINKARSLRSVQKYSETFLVRKDRWIVFSPSLTEYGKTVKKVMSTV